MSARESAKDLFYSHVPPAVARHLLPVLPGGSPYGEKILETEAIFVHVPKAAGSSIKTELYGAPLYGHRRIVEFYAYDPVRAAAFFKFGFVRNPWDRLLSAWTYLVQGEGTNRRDRAFAREHLSPLGDFTAFVTALDAPRRARRVLRYDHFRSQAHWICLPGQSGHALDFLGRFERMEDDMAALRAQLGLPPRAATRIRGSDHPPYRDAYTERTRGIVADLYAEDIRLLGYAF